MKLEDFYASAYVLLELAAREVKTQNDNNLIFISLTITITSTTMIIIGEDPSCWTDCH